MWSIGSCSTAFTDRSTPTVFVLATSDRWWHIIFFRLIGHFVPSFIHAWCSGFASYIIFTYLTVLDLKHITVLHSSRSDCVSVPPWGDFSLWKLNHCNKFKRNKKNFRPMKSGINQFLSNNNFWNLESMNILQIFFFLFWLLTTLFAEMNQISILLTQIFMQYGIETTINYDVNNK